MRLCEHPDFQDILIAAAALHGVSEQIVEKDYYVTQALRAVAEDLGEWGIFKGGTSLSKGWGLIKRFSEDIDLFVNPVRDSGRLSTRGIDRELKRVHELVAQVPGLHLEITSRVKVSAKALHDRFSYETRFHDQRVISTEVLLESGIFSGEQPTEIRDLSSLAAELLYTRGLAHIAEDTGRFPMRLLHFRRTFVEKLFAIHARVERMLNGGGGLGTYARHYYDLYCLATREEVRRMLESEEFDAIRHDYHRISSQAFSRDYTPPPSLSFCSSAALFPDLALRHVLAAEYDRQCRLLCFGEFPSFDEVLGVLEDLRPLLR